jgi:hypothetical protein
MKLRSGHNDACGAAEVKQLRARLIEDPVDPY